MPTLSPRASFWTAAAVAGLALWSSGAPSIVYPLYEAQWRLSSATSTLIFAVYPLALIPVLLEIAKWSAGTDPATDAPPEWIAAVERDKPAMTALITDTVRRGGSVFAGPDSVVAQLAS